MENGFVVRQRVKETINGSSYGFHPQSFEISAILLPCRGVKTLD